MGFNAIGPSTDLFQTSLKPQRIVNIVLSNPQKASLLLSRQLPHRLGRAADNHAAIREDFTFSHQRSRTNDAVFTNHRAIQHNRANADQREVQASRNAMSLAESGLGNAVDLMQTARETIVAAGNGMTLLPQLAAQPVLQGASYLPFEAPAPARTIGLLYRATSNRNTFFKTFGACIRTHVEAHLPKGATHNLPVRK